MSLRADGLTIQYNAATSTSPSELIISGGTSFSFDGHTVSLNLGGKYSQGLVIVGGQLQSLQAAVAGEIDLLGLTIEADSLTIAYVAAAGSNPAEFALFGGVRIDSSFLNFDTTLGSESDPGILINGSQLEKLNIDVNGGFSLFGIDVSAKNLTINYSADANELELSGSVMLDFTSDFEVAASIGGGGLFINTQTGALSIPSAGLTITASADLGPFSIPSLMISYSNGPNGVNFIASGEADLPDDIKVSLDKLDIVNGQLSDIGLTLDASIAIGDSGFFLDSLSGSLQNLNNPSQLVVMASAEVSFGKKVTIAGNSYALVDATGSITITPSELDLNGNVTLVGGLLGQGNADLNLDWGTGIYKVSGSFGMFDNIINFTGSLDITNQGNITLEATASVNVPPQIPFIGGDSLGNLNFYLQYRPGQPLTDDFAAAWTSLNLFFTSVTIGFEIDFQGDVSVINGNDVAAIQAAAASSQPSQFIYSQDFSAPIVPSPMSLAPSYQITATSPAFNGAYPVTPATDNNVSGIFGGTSTSLFTDYQLSHSDVILSTLSFNVSVDSPNVNGPILIGTGSFDAQGNFHFTPNGNQSIVPSSAILSSDGDLILRWPGQPYGAIDSTVDANYNAADAYLELLQETTNGTYVQKGIYSIDPVSNDPGDFVQSAIPAELLTSDQGLQGSITIGNNSQTQTEYTLTHGGADPKTVRFSLYQGSTLLGTGYFSDAGTLHFTPNGNPSMIPTAGSVFLNQEGGASVKLNWASPPPPTSINVTYAVTGNRVIDYNLSNSESTPNGVAGQYEIEVVSTSPIKQPIDFSATPLYQPPTVSFATPSPMIP